MAKYAVIKMKGTQYKVSEGDEILVDKMNGKPSADVLLVVNDGNVRLGNPTVKGAKVNLKVVEEEVKGDKLYIQKFKAKSRYRRKLGYRHKFTKISIGKIT